MNWEMITPGHWRFGSWRADYGQGPPDSAVRHVRGWWLTYGNRQLVPARGQPFATLSEVQDWAAEHHPNEVPVAEPEFPGRRDAWQCPRTEPHLSHTWEHLTRGLWADCPGVQEEHCAQADWHNPHPWDRGAPRWCPGTTGTTAVVIRGGMTVAEIVSLLAQVLSKDQKRAVAERFTHPAFKESL